MLTMVFVALRKARLGKGGRACGYRSRKGWGGPTSRNIAGYPLYTSQAVFEKLDEPAEVQDERDGLVPQAGVDQPRSEGKGMLVEAMLNEAETYPRLATLLRRIAASTGRHETEHRMLNPHNPVTKQHSKRVRRTPSHQRRRLWHSTQNRRARRRIGDPGLFADEGPWSLRVHEGRPRTRNLGRARLPWQSLTARFSHWVEMTRRRSIDQGRQNPRLPNMQLRSEFLSVLGEAHGERQGNLSTRTSQLSGRARDRRVEKPSAQWLTGDEEGSKRGTSQCLRARTRRQRFNT